jgi:hypothetical protein
MERGPPIWYSGLKPPFAPPEPKLLANVYVEWPVSGSVRLFLGEPKLGWLKMLKNSARNRMFMSMAKYTELGQN